MLILSKIEAQFGWGEELYTELNNIANAENQGKHLKLYIDDSVIWIYNLVNAKDLCQYILSHISNPSNTTARPHQIVGRETQKYGSAI